MINFKKKSNIFILEYRSFFIIFIHTGIAELKMRYLNTNPLSNYDVEEDNVTYLLRHKLINQN